MAELVKATCPKCGKPYQRIGERFDEHVAECDGTPYRKGIHRVGVEGDGRRAISELEERAAAILEELDSAYERGKERLEDRRLKVRKLAEELRTL